MISATSFTERVLMRAGPVLLLLLWIGAPVHADDPFTHGEANDCFNCHATDPASLPEPRFPPPKIAGQEPEYLAKALNDYRMVARSHYLMNSPANDISADDLESLTLYLSTITAAQLPSWDAPVLDADSVAKGAALAEAHCAICHSPTLGSGAPGTPTLNGQYQAYFIKAMEDYRLGMRQSAVMYEAISGLSDDEIADLAAFYASLPGLHPSSGN
jgi:cytochrome c553